MQRETSPQVLRLQFARAISILSLYAEGDSKDLI